MDSTVSGPPPPFVTISVNSFVRPTLTPPYVTELEFRMRLGAPPPPPPPAPSPVKEMFTRGDAVSLLLTLSVALCMPAEPG